MTITGLTYHVSARRVDLAESIAEAKSARLIMDTGLAGRADAFNPAELLLASLAACMLKGIERVSPMIGFAWSGAEVELTGHRQDSPPKMVSITYELVVDTDETDQRLDLLHRNIRKYGTISNTLAEALALEGTIRRKD